MKSNTEKIPSSTPINTFTDLYYRVLHQLILGLVSFLIKRGIAPG